MSSRWRPSAQLLLTLSALVTATLIVFFLVAVMRQSLYDTYPTAIADVTSAAWTVGILLIGLAGLGAWLVAGYVLQPIWGLRRSVALSARSRAMGESHQGELLELESLRVALGSVLQEMEAGVRLAELERGRLLGLFENISEGIVQIDADARFVNVNAAARQLLRLPAHPERNSALALIRHTELRELIQRAAAGDHVAPTEIVVDGRPLLIGTQSLSSKHQDIPGAIMTVVDLTELRRLEGVRRDFVANVSHELKTPLTSIRGYSETLLGDEMPREAQLEFVDVIHKNAVRLQRIVEDLLDLSRLQSGGWRPNLREVDVATLAEDVWANCQPLAEPKNIKLTVSAQTRNVIADEGGLRQVLSNLLDNAIRYSPANGSVTVTIEPRNGNTEIEVRDNGVGIPPESLPRIFERFYRVDASRSRYEGGTGLGLSIVKHLVERMGGEVSAESEVGKGTAIHVLLPHGAR